MYKYTNIYSIWVVQVGHVQVTWAGVSLNLAGYLAHGTSYAVPGVRMIPVERFPRY